MKNGETAFGAEAEDFALKEAPGWMAWAWRQRPIVRSVEVEGAVVRYRAWNPGATDKQGLILQHGFRAHARWWDHVAPFLTDRYRVVAPDFTGMGDSDWRPTYSRKQFGREILAVAKHAGFDRFVGVAHSFSGVSMLHAMITTPEAFDRVVVIDADAFRDEDDGRPVPYSSGRIYPDLDTALAAYRLTPPGKWPDPHVLAYLGRHSLREKDGGWSWKFDPDGAQSVSNEKVRADLVGFQRPVDYVYGDCSEIAGPETVARFLERVPTCARPIAIPASHHHIMIEQPVALIAILKAILAERR